jgi:hypothetical protein
MPTQNASPKKSRGGQPGNLNALKHGFYTRYFTNHDLAGVTSTDFDGLMEEIAIIRLYARRLIELDNLSADISQVTNILRILCLASLTITRLVKTRQILRLADTSSADDLHQVLEQLTRELHLDQPDPPPQPLNLPFQLPPT